MEARKLHDRAPGQPHQSHDDEGTAPRGYPSLPPAGEYSYPRRKSRIQGAFVSSGSSRAVSQRWRRNSSDRAFDRGARSSGSGSNQLTNRFDSGELIGGGGHGLALAPFHQFRFLLKVLDNHLGIEHEMVCREQHRKAKPDFRRRVPAQIHHPIQKTPIAEEIAGADSLPPHRRKENSQVVVHAQVRWLLRSLRLPNLQRVISAFEKGIRLV